MSDNTTRTDGVPDRRTVLKTIGAGLLGTTAIAGPASAGGDGDTGAYGNGNGLGAWLNEKAEFKQHPIWTGEIADKRGESVVDVAVGAMTSIDVPNGPPAGPVGFAPRAVLVSPGTTIRWTWESNPLEIPIPHDVTSLVNADGEPVLEPHADQRFHHQDQYTPASKVDGLEEDVNPTFEFTFEEPGNHLYYCTPHGAPFRYHDHPKNMLGMRGAVVVTSDAP